jgi:hypothetical protein
MVISFPQEGHLQQVYHIFAYLGQFNRAMLVFYDAEPNIGDTHFHVCDCASHYPDATEQLPDHVLQIAKHDGILHL